MDDKLLILEDTDGDGRADGARRSPADCTTRPASSSTAVA